MCRNKETGKITVSFKEMVTSGMTGETSATGFCGVILTFTAILVFLGLFVFYLVNQDEAGNILEFVDKVIVILGIGSALLGTRKISGALANRRSNADVIKMVEEAIEAKEERDEKIVRRKMFYADASANYTQGNPEEEEVDA
jgi:hypothetical protein